MKWNTKNKAACALIIPDTDDYSFLPLSKKSANSLFESLLLLNLSWQIQSIKSALARQRFDTFIFFSGSKPVKNKPEIKKIFYPVTPFFKTKSSSAIMQEKMQSILNELSEKYFQCAVWNLESPLIHAAHIDKALQPGVVLNISSCENRPLLISNNVEKKEQRNMILPALYDLHSISDIIRNMSSDDIYSDRALELKSTMDLIRRSLQSAPVSHS